MDKSDTLYLTCQNVIRNFDPIMGRRDKKIIGSSAHVHSQSSKLGQQQVLAHLGTFVCELLHGNCEFSCLISIVKPWLLLALGYFNNKFMKLKLCFTQSYES